MLKKKIYFHADDYGRTSIISQKILQCVKNGNLNSVSVIINKNDKFHKKLKKLQKSKNIKIKLHLNLTDRPELGNYKNKELFKRINFLKLFFVNAVEKKQIIEEIKYQIDNFIKIYNPKHLKIDGHQHVHMIPWIFDFLLKNKKKYKIKEIRIPDESLLLPEITDLFNIKYYRNILALIILKTLSQKININQTYSPKFSGVIYTGIQNKKTIIKTIKSLKKKNHKNYEILIHPGHTNKNEIGKFEKSFYKYNISKNRKVEYNLCFSKEINNELKSFNLN